MQSSSVTITGLDEIGKIFAAMDPWQLNPIIKEGQRAAAEIVAEEARKDAPSVTGLLRKGIKVKAGKNTKTYRSTLVSVSKTSFKGDQFYAAFQEFGFKTGTRKSKNRREIAGKHFLQKAFEAKAQQAQEAMVGVWQARIKEAAGL